MKNEGPIETAVSEALLNDARHHLLRDYLPKIRSCLKLLDQEDLWWSSNPNTNSVGTLILHLCGNVRQWIISGLGGKPDRRRRNLEFQERGIDKEELLERLEGTVREAAAVLEGMTGAELLKNQQIQVYDVSGVQAVVHVVEHFAYHTGQIIYITRLRKNVDLKFYSL